ncbi:hypothetical protein Y032_0243g3477 [Ancylostoma ceylanicum]|nr:hypothetical protein Y032_0243g3477 [Ancylostoma ceylanicum]
MLPFSGGLRKILDFQRRLRFRSNPTTSSCWGLGPVCATRPYINRPYEGLGWAITLDLLFAILPHLIFYRLECEAPFRLGHYTTSTTSAHPYCLTD